MSISPIEAAARRIYQLTQDQPWGAASMREEEAMREIAARALEAAHGAAVESPAVVAAVANAISQSSGMRFDGFWTRMEELEPEDRDHAISEARAGHRRRI